MKYLSPAHEQESLGAKAAEEWKALSPLFQDASAIAGKLSLPAGGALKTAAGWLDTIAKLKLNSLPQAKGYGWSVAKVTEKIGDEVVQGIVWQLPRKVLTQLGGRLTGSVAVSFIPTTDLEQQTPPVPQYGQGTIRCQAVVRTEEGGRYLAPPDKKSHLELRISPQSPGMG